MLKKAFFLILILLGMCAFAAKSADGQTVTIHTAGDQATGEVIHRSPVIIPITCFIDVPNLHIYFLSDLGTVSIEIENLSTGEESQFAFNALAGPMILPISGTPGHWLIRFTLSSGVQYYGEFDI